MPNSNQAKNFRANYSSPANSLKSWYLKHSELLFKAGSGCFFLFLILLYGANSPHPPSAPSPQGEGRWTRWFCGKESCYRKFVLKSFILPMNSPHPPAAPSPQGETITGISAMNI